MSKENLIKAIVKLDNCWGHHQDGSDLLVDKNELFDIVYNGVMPLLKDTLGKTVGDTKSKYYCSTCGLTHEPGGPCKECYNYWIVEHYKMEEKRKSKN